MFSLPRSCHLMYGCLACLLVAAVFLGAPAALSGGQTQGSPQADPWSVYSWGGHPWHGYFSPSCHELSYFSGTPLLFAYGGDLSKWTPDSFSLKTKADLLGAIQKHRVYQVIQDIHPSSQSAAVYAQEISVKRILLERRPDEFCMIFQEQGSVGNSGVIFRMDPATLATIDGEPVLLTHDLCTGNGGYTIDGAWILENCVPLSLIGPLNDSIDRALKETFPPGCGLRPNRNGLDLGRLGFDAQIWPKDERAGGPSCEGGVLLKLGMRNRRLVVVDKQYPFP